MEQGFPFFGTVYIDVVLYLSLSSGASLDGSNPMSLRQTLDLALIEALFNQDDKQAGIVMLAIKYVKLRELYETPTENELFESDEPSWANVHNLMPNQST